MTAMARETAEAPEAVARMLERNGPAFAEIGRLFRGQKPSHLVTSARGSSDHAASYLKYLVEIELGLPCCSIGASVVSIYGTRLRLRDTVLVTISQSGRSPDILAFQADAKRAGVPTLAIVNDEASPLARGADLCLPLSAGPEKSVAATKTFIASAALAARLVAACAEDGALIAAAEKLPEALARATSLSWPAAEAALTTASSLYVLGRGPSLAMAEEAALKLKETCTLHAEAYSAAEVLHGPMEIVGPGFPVLAFAPADASEATMLATLDRLAAAGAQVLRLGAPGLPCAATMHTLLDPLAMILTFYAGAERIARARGRDPDRPRLLQKVTETR